jgi:hypothetical protein
MTDPVERIARAAATRLTTDHGPSLAVDVEAALHTRGTTREPDRYFDPIALGALIVSVATLAWTIYTDLKQKTPNPSPDVLARTIRVRLQEAGIARGANQDRPL